VVAGEEASAAFEEFTFPVASGWIAGESLMGVALVLWESGPELVRRLPVADVARRSPGYAQRGKSPVVGGPNVDDAAGVPRLGRGAR